MTFHFDPSAKRAPLELGHTWPYIHPRSRDRIKTALAVGCYCQHDGPRTASLTQRNGGAWLQCDACGHSLGNAMPRAEHPHFDTYPAWRTDLDESYQAASRAHLHTFSDEKAARAEAYAVRVREYDEWCRHSPEWAEFKKRIFWRSRGHCEACLSGNAEVVHYLTYEFGKIPPAWQVKAVCRLCHKRLHDGEDEWCTLGMARS